LEKSKLVFLSPFLFLLIFSILPGLFLFVMSFYEWSIMTPVPEFIGLENYLYMFADEKFLQSLFNSLYYTFFMVVLITPLSIIAALIFFYLGKLRNFFMAFFFFPMLVSLIVLGTVWSVMYFPFGPINNILNMAGLPRINFYAKDIVKLAIIAVYVWRDTGYFGLMILGGLLSIPPSIFDSAKIDGASFTQTLFKVTLPILKPIIFLVVILLTVGGFSVFSIPYIMTYGGPGYASMPLILYIYFSGWHFYKMGYASAQASILLLIILAIYAVQKKYLGGT